ncbi:MAG: cytochrome P450 [Pyrinomonadaceae bacterium]
MSIARLPPGPKVNALNGLLLATRLRNPLEFLTSVTREYGDIVYFKVGSRRIFVLNHPDYIKNALTRDYKNFSKRDGTRPGKHFLGRGLIVSDGDYHRAQRKLIQPAFHHQQIALYAATIVEHGLRYRERWRNGQVIDIERETGNLTLGIISKLLFGIETEAAAEEIRRSILTIFSRFRPFGIPFAKLFGLLPKTGRVEQAEALFDEIIYGFIKQRHNDVENKGDILSLLMNTENDENSRMSDVQVRDEALTIFLTGQETVSNALTWTWYLLSLHPEVEAKLYDEIDTVIGGRAPALSDVAQLSYTEMVFAESMRLFPPAWALARFVLKEYQVGGYTLPAGSIVIMSPYVMHRDSRYFPDPCRFDPERWKPEAKAARPAYSYFPFGGGAKSCIGEGMARMEGILLIATIAQRWRMQLVRDHPIKLEPVVTLRTKHGIMMKALRRE